MFFSFHDVILIVMHDLWILCGEVYFVHFSIFSLSKAFEWACRCLFIKINWNILSKNFFTHKALYFTIIIEFDWCDNAIGTTNFNFLIILIFTESNTNISVIMYGFTSTWWCLTIQYCCTYEKMIHNWQKLSKLIESNLIQNFTLWCWWLNR